jgi:hypothetical protein
MLTSFESLSEVRYKLGVSKVSVGRAMRTEASIVLLFFFVAVAAAEEVCCRSLFCSRFCSE